MAQSDPNPPIGRYNSLSTEDPTTFYLGEFATITITDHMGSGPPYTIYEDDKILCTVTNVSFIYTPTSIGQHQIIESNCLNPLVFTVLPRETNNNLFENANTVYINQKEVKQIETATGIIYSKYTLIPTEFVDVVRDTGTIAGRLVYTENNSNMGVANKEIVIHYRWNGQYPVYGRTYTDNNGYFTTELGNVIDWYIAFEGDSTYDSCTYRM